jgi:hypothetical protein
VKILAQFRFDQLDRMEAKLNVILLLEGINMADEAALDQALSELSGQLTALIDASKVLIEKVQAVPDAPDLSDEWNAIQELGTKVNEATAAITEAVTAPAPVEEVPPTGEAPPEETSPTP